MTELYWDDIEAIVKMLKSDLYKNVIVPYEEKFMALKEIKVILTEEYLQK